MHVNKTEIDLLLDTFQRILKYIFTQIYFNILIMNEKIIAIEHFHYLINNTIQINTRIICIAK
jgi:hypothetical protein